jgi:hypothetical protein
MIDAAKLESELGQARKQIISLTQLLQESEDTAAHLAEQAMVCGCLIVLLYFKQLFCLKRQSDNRMYKSKLCLFSCALP